MQGLLPLYRYFDFSGRSGRAEFWQFAGLATAAIIAALLVDVAISNARPPLFTIFVLVLLAVPYNAVAVRRLHDRGWSGKLIILGWAVTPISFGLWYLAGAYQYSPTGDIFLLAARTSNWINRGVSIFFIVAFMVRGDDGPNRFGPPPTDDRTPAPTPRDLVEKARETAASLSSPRPSQAQSDPLDQIERLAKLHDSGALTDDEFATKKSALLSRL